jgi:hypothetical protein
VIKKPQRRLRPDLSRRADGWMDGDVSSIKQGAFCPYVTVTKQNKTLSVRDNNVVKVKG